MATALKIEKITERNKVAMNYLLNAKLAIEKAMKGLSQIDLTKKQKLPLEQAWLKE